MSQKLRTQLIHISYAPSLQFGDIHCDVVKYKGQSIHYELQVPDDIMLTIKFMYDGSNVRVTLDVTEVKISTQPYLPETVVTDIIDCISKQVSIDG